MARFVRVVRTLVIEGDEQWVNQTLDGSFIRPDRPFTPRPGYSIQESRGEVEVIAEQEAVDGSH